MHPNTTAAYCSHSVLDCLSWQCIRRHQYTDQSLIIQLQSVRCLYSHQRCRSVPFSVPFSALSLGKLVYSSRRKCTVAEGGTWGYGQSQRSATLFCLAGCGPRGALDVLEDVL